MTRAEQLNQYVTDLEDYVAQHGHLPAAARSTPATNTQRLKYALGSTRTNETVKQRIRTLLDAPRYGSRHGQSKQRQVRPLGTFNAAPVLDYVGRLEDYLDQYGHLPPVHAPGALRTDKAKLNRYAEHPYVDDAVKQRIRTLLTKPGKVRARTDAAVEEFEALPSAAATLSKSLTAIQAEVLNWITAERRLPSPVSNDLQEMAYYHFLGRARRASIRGTATLRTAELILLIPGLLTAEERVQASAQVASRLAAAAEREARKNRLGSLEDRWDKGFEELSAWVAAHGALPRRRTFDADEYRVANWLNVQRMQLRDNNLRLEWKDRLAIVPGALEPKAQLRGEAELAKTVADFYERHGRLPRADAPAPESTVGGRLQKLRSRISDRTIGRDALKVLEAIPGAAEIREHKPPMQRLADLEDFVRTTGTFPAQNSGGLSNWAYRALNGQGSKRQPEAAELRRAVRELRDSVPYKVTRRKKQGLEAYVTELEAYIVDHGRLPASSKWASPQLKLHRLRSGLDSEQTDDLLRARIRRVLSAPPYNRGRAAA